MSNKHGFIFSPGEWIGQGRISFSASHETLAFYTKWIVESPVDGIITCRQQVEMEGREETLYNNFNFSKITENGFTIHLSNELIGDKEGKGVIDSKTLAWEFRNSPDFEGFEVYERKDNGDYFLHAEFTAGDNFRTIIDGKIWMKS